MYSNRVLIVEDDPKIVDLVTIHLNDLGLEVQSAADGISGLEKALNNKYALIILDLMLPQMEGMEVCRRIKESDKFTPILMLTAKSEEIDKVLGLEIGADDYITKPFGIREFVARVKAIIRRVDLDNEKHQNQENETRLEFKDFIIDLEKHTVMHKNKRIELTAKEFELLRLFASHPGNTYSRERLLSLVWGYQYEGYEHTVSSHINRLRNKIEEDPANPKLIKTLWGVGYRFEVPGE